MDSFEGKYATLTYLRSLPRDKPGFFETIWLVRSISTRTSRTGSEYLSVELGDYTGSFVFTCFNDTPLHAVLSQEGEDIAIRVKGQTGYYQDRFSPRISEASALARESFEDSELLNHLVATSVENPGALYDELAEAVARIKRPTLQATVRAVLDGLGEAFRNAPAAMSMHHAYRSGLLEHTVHMVRAAEALLPLYHEVDRDLALAGVILHDVGKCSEYGKGLSPKKTKSGILQGHVVLGYRIVRKAAIQSHLEAFLQERLEHIILSHQGEMEWGAASMAATPEAVFVSMIDNLDAKMGMVQQALRSTPKNEPFSDWLPGLKAPMLTEPVQPEQGGAA